MSKRFTTALTAAGLLLAVWARPVLAEVAPQEHRLANARLALTVQSQGAIISDVRLRPEGANLLADPAVADPVMFGHFLCFDRWGQVAPEAAARGIPFHGEAVRFPWRWTELSARSVGQEVTLPIAGLSARRQVRLAERDPVYAVTLEVTNFTPETKAYTAVEHATLGEVWLHDEVRLSSNARQGLVHASPQPKVAIAPDWESVFTWPLARVHGRTVDLRNTPGPGPRFLVSLMFADETEWAWIIQIDRTSGDLIGYVWSPTDYPWLMLYYSRGARRFLNRSIEFGTTGLYLPRQQLAKIGQFLDRPVLAHLAPGASRQHRFWGFACKAPPGSSAVTQVTVESDGVRLAFDQGEAMHLQLPDPE